MPTLEHLTLLHSNDMHGDFMAEQVDENLIGGVSRLSGYVNKVRGEEENVVYCIAGDMFRGSVIDSEFKGLSTIELMNLLAPDVATIGNHEVDYGIAHLLFLEKCAKFPIINSNLYIKSNRARLFTPYKVIERGDMKILFIGIITQEVLASAKSDKDVGTFIDTEAAAAEVARICDSHRGVDIDFTVLLTHIGFEEDKALAAMLDPALGVDVIVGGHSHTVLERPELVNGIYIVQAGTGTDQIGRFDIEVDTDDNCVHSWKWQLVPIDGDCPRDEDMEKLIHSYKNVTDRKYARIVTRFKRQLTHPSRTQETELGDLYADVLRDSLGLDIMLLGSGSIRTERLGPVVEYGSLVENFPYNDTVFAVKLTGAQLRRAVLHIFRDEAWTGHTEFYQFSHGLRAVYSKGAHALRELTFEGDPVRDDQIFTVGLQNFHRQNIESCIGVTEAEVQETGKPRVASTASQTVLDEVLTGRQMDDRVAGERIVILP